MVDYISPLFTQGGSVVRPWKEPLLGAQKAQRQSFFKIKNTLKAMEMLKRVSQLQIKTTAVMQRKGASRIKKNSGLLCGARMVDKVITSGCHD